MEYEVFYNKIISHLCTYKRESLHIKESGHYIKENKKTKKIVDYGEREWILPNDVKYQNYMCQDAVDCSKKIHQHDDWYHLNSSQTLCLNYFSLLLKNNYMSLNTLLSRLLNKEIDIVKAEFEKSGGKNSSNFDFYCEDKEGHKYYFEVKYTEADVTKSTTAKDPHKTFNDKYKPLIENNGYLKKCLIEENWKDFMFNHYQAYRNIVMANEEKGNYSFFITMKNNDGTNQELNSAIKDSGDDLKNVIWLYWEDLMLETIQLFENDKTFKEYYEEMKKKYII